MIRIAVLACDNVLNASLGITLDVLSVANRVAAEVRKPAHQRFALSVLGVRRRAVVTSSGHVLRADATLATWSRRRADIVLVPGIHLRIPRAQELLPMLASRDTRAAVAWLQAQWRAGAVVAASCSSTFLLAEAGMLDGKVATTSWFLAPLFRARYPRVDLQAERMLTRDKRVLCAGASMAQSELALAVVTDTLGSAVADLCKRYLLLDERSSQQSYVLVQQLASQDDVAGRARAWVRRHLAEDFAIADLATAVALGPKTLARRIESATGASPIAFVQRIRVEAALDLLQTTTLSFDQIAVRVGYRDPSALRRILQRQLGRSAREIRKAYTT